MKRQALHCVASVLALSLSLTACGSKISSNPPVAITTATTVAITTTTIQPAVTATVSTTAPTVATTTQQPTTTVYIPDPTPEFEGTVLEIDGDDVLIRVDKVIEGPHLEGTVWANKNSLWKHHGGNVWVVGMPIKVDYTGELTKSDPPRLKTVIMFCDCPYYLQTTRPRGTTATSLTTTDPKRTKTSKLPIATTP